MGAPPPGGVAEVDRPPDDEGWVTDFLAWQPGGEMACRPAPGPPGTEPLPDAGEPEPVVVEIWDGLVDACTGRPESGNRSIRLSLSDRIAGTFTVSTVCSGPLSAGAVYRTFPGAQERRRVAVDGTVTVTGIAPDDVIEGAFSVLFEGDAIFTSGTFRAAPGCVSAGR